MAFCKGAFKGELLTRSWIREGVVDLLLESIGGFGLAPPRLI